MGEENQFSTGKRESEESVKPHHAWSKADFTSSGNLKREYFKSHSYSPATTMGKNLLDSDGTLGSSGNESDSSEELHYGPGFVSRLKSRYMSVALRGTTGKSGLANRKRSNLRRTASLEDFLEQEKNADDTTEITETAAQTELKPSFTKNRTPATTSRYRPRGPPVTASTTTSTFDSRASRSKDRVARTESLIKRCQSVEVLSVHERLPYRQPAAAADKPPPLPPKAESTNSSKPLENILNTTLANEVHLVENVADSKSAIHSKPADTGRYRRSNSQQLTSMTKPSSPPDVSATSMASLKRPFHKRRSSGLLFGVEERELPAPDTVKETRKIFESIDKTNRPAGSRPAFLTKSQSTSSLYSSSVMGVSSTSRSPSRDRLNNNNAYNNSNNNNAATSRLTRKKSDENLASRRQMSPQHRVSFMNTANNRMSSSPTRSSLYKHVTAKVNSKPTLPAKPTNLPARRNSIDADAKVAAPELPAKKTSPTATLETRPRASLPSPPLELEDGMKVISKDSLQNIRQSGATYSFSFQSNLEPSSGNQPGHPASKSYLPNLASANDGNGSTKQIGIIRPIAREPDKVNHVHKDEPEVIEKEVIVLRREERTSEVPAPYLTRASGPKLPHVTPATADNRNVIKTTRAPPTTISTVASTTTATQPSWMNPNLKHAETHSSPPASAPPPIPVPRGFRTTDNSNVGQILTARPAIISTSDSSEETEDSSYEPAKVMIIEPPPKFSSTQHMVTRAEASTAETISRSFARPSAATTTTSSPSPTTRAASTSTSSDRLSGFKPPSVEKSVSPQDSPTLTQSSKADAATETSAKSAAAAIAAKKKLAEPASTSMVFNFVNSDKNVSHIENDGLDMSKRNRNKPATKDSGVVILTGGFGESTDDGDENSSSSDAEEVDHTRPVSPCRVTFIGANVVHGKSSLRSKAKTKKMNISFSSDLPEIFEYPSFEAAQPVSNTSQSSSTLKLKSTNNALGSFGGLGSYTPSKAGLDSSFQLGVTRTPVKVESKNSDENQSNLDDVTAMTSSNDNLWPTKDAVSWSGQTSAFTDMLF